MNTLKVGIASYKVLKARSMAIARGEYHRQPGEPKIWFTSLESLSKVLSEKNRELLQIIAEREPQSLKELAQAAGREESNLSRTLKRMEGYGIVRLTKGAHGRVIPQVLHDRVSLELSLR